MIALIIKCYFILFVSIALGSLFLFVMGLFFILKKRSTVLGDDYERPEPKIFSLKNYQEKNKLWQEPHFNFNDLGAIAGDDVLSTQLDLARAYIESDKKLLAKNILQYVVQQGTNNQRSEAEQLLNSI